MTKTMTAIMIAGIMTTGAVAADKAAALKESCSNKGGVFSQIDNDQVRAYTCRDGNGDLVGVYLPEQTIVLTAGDAKTFEESMKWGKK